MAQTPEDGPASAVRQPPAPGDLRITRSGRSPDHTARSSDRPVEAGLSVAAGWRARRGTSARSGEGLSAETNHRDQGPDLSFANATHADADAVWRLRVPNGAPQGVPRAVMHVEADRHADRKRGVAAPSPRRLFGVLGHEPSGEWRWGGCFGSSRNDQLASASRTVRGLSREVTDRACGCGSTG